MTDYFERVEADILLEKEVNMQKLDTYYKELVDDVHERKIKCLQDIKTNNISDNELDTMKQTLIEHESVLKKKKLYFILKTLGVDHFLGEFHLEKKKIF